MTQRVLRGDLFGIFCFNLLALIAAIAASLEAGEPLHLSLVITGVNLLYLVVLAAVRAKALTRLLDGATSDENIPSITEMLGKMEKRDARRSAKEQHSE